MAGPGGENCAGCYFWQLFGDGEEEDGEPYQVGSCHRMPPTMPGEPGKVRTDPDCHAWMGANSKSGYWCGEFRPREQK